MVTGARIAAGLALTLLAVGPTRAQDECSSTNLRACVNHEWDTPTREFDLDELKQWHKAFHYADWERNHDSEKTLQCDNHVKTMGQLVFENALDTRTRTMGHLAPNSLPGAGSFSCGEKIAPTWGAHARGVLCGGNDVWT